MRDGEIRLSYPGTDITFGLLDSQVGAFLTERPDLGDYAIEAADVQRPRADGVAFGTDSLGGRTITLSAAVSKPTEAEALDEYARVRTAWRGDKVRQTPGAVAALTFNRAGRERIAYGRPRRFAEDMALARSGVVGFTADYSAVDDVFYSVSESSATVALVPAPGGGLIAPLASPMMTTESSDRSVGIDVSGDLPAWPVLTVDGPITNPVIEVVGLWRMEFRLTLAYDQTLVVDTRPWGRSALVNGASVAGSLTRQSTRLADASIPPGSYEVALRGSSETGSPVLRLSWRDSFTTL